MRLDKRNGSRIIREKAHKKGPVKRLEYAISGNY